jgi:bifunctional DNA-binding transcriptional regulator/antitoxin component of YhaV-PrlF toxin-antitoxin module
VVDEFTKIRKNFYQESKKDSISFTSQVDCKGRVLISASIRRKLRLRYGSKVIVNVNCKEFSTKIDERGRFVVPVVVRRGASLVSGVISVSNGCDGVVSAYRLVEPKVRVKFPVMAPVKIRDVQRTSSCIWGCL